MSNEKSMQVMKNILERISGMGCENITEDVFAGIDTSDFGFSGNQEMNDKEFCSQFLVALNNAIEEATKKMIAQSFDLHKLRVQHNDVSHVLRVILVGKENADTHVK